MNTEDVLKKLLIRTMQDTIKGIQYLIDHVDELEVPPPEEGKPLTILIPTKGTAPVGFIVVNPEIFALDLSSCTTYKIVSGEIHDELQDLK